MGKTRIFLCSLAVFFVFLKGALAAGVGEWPTRPIELYIGYPAGGPLDSSMRIYSPIMSQELGVPVVIINKPGGGGSVCEEYVAAAKPDGYTLQEGAWNLLATRPFFVQTKYTLRDFTLILGHSDFNFAIVVRKDAPYKDFGEWIEYARKNPNTKLGMVGTYGIPRLAMGWITRHENIKVLYVPFKGDNEGIPALLGGHIDMWGSAGVHFPLVEAGKLRTLLQLSGEIADTTKVQRLTEYYPDFPEALKISVEAPTGLAGPKGIPAPIVQKLAGALKKGVESEAHRKLLKETGRKLMIWNSEEGHNNLTKINQAYPPFLKQIGFMK